MESPFVQDLLAPRRHAVECATVADWWPRWRAIAATHRSPFARAVAGGAEADRLRWAFASGYQAALRALVPSLPDETIAAFCVTEAEGNFPRAIHATLTPEGSGFRLSGEKRWATLGPGGGLFIVVAREAGSDAARPFLKAVRVESGMPGLSVVEMPPTGFLPEVTHAKVRLDNVRVEAPAVLEGDGYAQYTKPFRTIEDIHVHAACIAWLVAEARRRGWPAAWAERALMLLHALAGIAKLDPRAPSTHIALGGALATGEGLVLEADALWAIAAEDPAALRWARDRSIFGVAGKARAQRLAAAWARLDAGTQ